MAAGASSVVHNLLQNGNIEKAAEIGLYLCFFVDSSSRFTHRFSFQLHPTKLSTHRLLSASHWCQVS